jgi:hypothetical protein
MIWLLRPGGLADRQPRSSWLFGTAFFAVVIACYVILRPGSRLKVDRRIALAGSLGLIAVVTVGAGVFLRTHGGLLRHTPKPFTPTATTLAPGTAATTTTVAGGSSTTTAAGASTTTTPTAPGSTVTPSTKSTVATTTSTIP